MGLSELIDGLKTVDPQDKDRFHELFRESMSILKLEETDVTKEFCTTIPTVKRWKEGKYSPHPIMREVVYKWLLKRAEEIYQ